MGGIEKLLILMSTWTMQAGKLKLGAFMIMLHGELKKKHSVKNIDICHSNFLGAVVYHSWYP